MTLLPGLTGDQLERLSAWALHGDFSDIDLAAVSGQAAHFSRLGTRSATDSQGVTRTLVDGQPAHEWADLDTDGVRETPGLLMGSTDRLWYDMLLHPTDIVLYAEFVERGSLAAGGAVLYVGNEAATGARILLESSGTQYRLTYTDGTTTRTSTMTGTAPVTGQRVQLTGTLSAAGVSQVRQRINGGTETGPAPAAALALPPAWGGARAYVASRGNAAASAILMLNAKVGRGAPPVTDLEAKR